MRIDTTRVAFALTIPRASGSALPLSVSAGSSVFLLGPNGSGKSGLMQRFYAENRQHARYVSAHRQNWFASSDLALSPLQKRQAESNMLQWDAQPQARWKDDLAPVRAGIALYDLMDAENVRARDIAAAVDGGRIGDAQRLSETASVIGQINDLLQCANLSIRIELRAGQEFRVTKLGNVDYGVSELSDGERNALLIAANVLTVKPGTLVLIDEPERHLHRSIINPLLSTLLSRRPDCAFVVSTHDVSLPLDNPDAQILIARSCSYSGASPAKWDVDLLEPGVELDETVKRAILGARRTILFVEGQSNSLDNGLYTILYPEASVVPCGTSRDVEAAVRGARSGQGLHWLNAYGVIDADDRVAEDVARLAELGVHVLPVSAVESVYYHPVVQALIARRVAPVLDMNETSILAAAADVLVESVASQSDRLCVRVAEQRARREVLRQLPTRSQVELEAPVRISVSTADLVASERAILRAAVQARDVLALVSRYPIRETPALDGIARALGFTGHRQYEATVRKLLRDDTTAVAAVRSLVQPLTAALMAESCQAAIV